MIYLRVSWQTATDLFETEGTQNRKEKKILSYVAMSRPLPKWWSFQKKLTSICAAGRRPGFCGRMKWWSMEMCKNAWPSLGVILMCVAAALVRKEEEGGSGNHGRGFWAEQNSHAISINEQRKTKTRPIKMWEQFNNGDMLAEGGIFLVFHPSLNMHVSTIEGRYNYT